MGLLAGLTLSKIERMLNSIRVTLSRVEGWRSPIKAPMWPVCKGLTSWFDTAHHDRNSNMILPIQQAIKKLSLQTL